MRKTSKRGRYCLVLLNACRVILGPKFYTELPSSDYPGLFCGLALVGPGTLPKTDSILSD